MGRPSFEPEGGRWRMVLRDEEHGDWSAQLPAQLSIQSFVDSLLDALADQFPGIHTEVLRAQAERSGLQVALPSVDVLPNGEVAFRVGHRAVAMVTLPDGSHRHAWISGVDFMEEGDDEVTVSLTFNTRLAPGSGG